MSHPGPSPDRPALTRGQRAASWFGLFGVPLVWVAHLLVCATLVASSCSGGIVQRNATPWADLQAIIYAASAIAFVLALAGAIAACRAWSASVSLASAAGTPRFIAWCGAVAAVGFAVGLVFTSCVVLAEPIERLCGPFR